MQAVARDPGLFRDEARRFMNLIAASRNRVLAILVEALHRMSGESGSWWEEKQCRSAVRSYEQTVAIEGGHSDEARAIMAKSLAAALRHWERKAPDELKQPVAWFASDHWLDMPAPTRAQSTPESESDAKGGTMRSHTRVLRRWALPFVLLAILAAARAGAEEPGKTWTLDSNNWQLGKDLLPEVVLNRVKSGEYHFKVMEVDPERFKQNYSKKFWEAGEANAGKYDLDPATCGLRDVKTQKVPDFYFGYPFPKIDPKDPQAACKMAQNFSAANGMANGGGATFTLNGIDGTGEFRRIKLWGHLQSFLGRSAGPLPNPENLRGTSMSSVTEPQDVDGVGGLTKTLNDWTSQDQAWFYVPATRRVRRVNAATRSDPLAGLDIFGDDVNCYAGKVEYYKWKLIGEGNVLAPVLSPYPLPLKQLTPTRWEVSIPYFKAAYETPGAKGAPWLIVDNLTMVPRPVWILEGQSDDPYYNFGKVIMYMDKDMYRIYWKLVHNRAGEYFYNAMCAYHWTKTEDGTFTAVVPNMVVGVNDKTNRAAIGGRYSSQFIENDFDQDYFTLHHLTHMSD